MILDIVKEMTEVQGEADTFMIDAFGDVMSDVPMTVGKICDKLGDVIEGCRETINLVNTRTTANRMAEKIKTYTMCLDFLEGYQTSTFFVFPSE